MNANVHERRKARAAATRAFLAFALVLSLAPAAAAQDTPDIEFTVRPANPGPTERSAAWLIHHREPGTRFGDAVVVENLASEPVDLILYAADGRTTPQGDFTVEPEEGPDEDVSTWVTLSRDRVSLDPGEAVRVPFVVDIPERAAPGDHPGGIVARTLEPLEGGPVPAHLAVAARLYLTVDGPLVHELRVTDIRAEQRDDGTHFFLDLENAGNTLLEVGGTYAVLGPFGTGGGEGRIDAPATLIPGASATKEVVWDGRALFGGRHTVRFALEYANGQRAVAEISFFMTPPFVVLASVGAAALLLSWLLLLPALRRRRRALAQLA